MAVGIWILEADVAKKIGVARQIVAAYRKNSLEKNREWRIHHNQVELSDFAIEKISTALGTTLPVPLANNGTQDVPQLVELQVARLCPNPRLLVARYPEDRRHLVYVSVRDSKNFRTGMRIKVRPADPQSTAVPYRLEGRCPRYPGKW